MITLDRSKTDSKNYLKPGNYTILIESAIGSQLVLRTKGIKY